ncbi:hypothetical protein M8818_001435 [Zalaria obscura]|uniref:Uncharacterized protein n=1 Tax=Zalaria obscura TaxID=2024903 RepID=A0ACC3SKA4_9PEZI
MPISADAKLIRRAIRCRLATFSSHVPGHSSHVGAVSPSVIPKRPAGRRRIDAIRTWSPYRLGCAGLLRHVAVSSARAFPMNGIIQMSLKLSHWFDGPRSLLYLNLGSA